MKRVVIIGAGQAGCQLAITLRERAFDGEIILVGEEHAIPYQRPPLSKAFLKGAAGADALHIKPADYYAEQGIDFRRGERAARIDVSSRRVILADDSSLAFEHLVLATGVRNRRFSVPNADAAGIVYLRTLGEAEILRSHMREAHRVVVIGAGFIGMEFAAVARQAGLDVTVVEQANRSMARAVSPTMSIFIEGRHREAGVTFRFGSTVKSVDVDADRRLKAVVLQDGEKIPAELAVVAIGVVPNVDLAETAGLAVRNGIVVDGRLATSDPRIHAIGDCACYRHPLYPDREIRLESVQNAADQARYLAGVMTGEAGDYESIPWFWSDQYDLKLQIAGLADANDAGHVEGDPADGRFSVRHMAGERLTAVETINHARGHMLARGELKRALAEMAAHNGGAALAGDRDNQGRL